jgi:hypothetical protein
MGFYTRYAPIILIELMLSTFGISEPRLPMFIFNTHGLSKHIVVQCEFREQKGPRTIDTPWSRPFCLFEVLRRG